MLHRRRFTPTANARHERRATNGPIVRTIALAGTLLLAIAACGSNAKSGVTARNANQSETTAGGDTTAVPTSATGGDTTEVTDVTAVSTTVVSTTAAPPPTEAPATTGATTTAAPTTAPATTLAAFPAGWRQVDSFDADLFPPFDESNWTGVPSPALPPAGQPLADGIYPADAIRWSPSNPGSLDIIVQRLDPCSTLPEDACINFGDPYGPDELGVNQATTLNMTVPLDESIGVGLTGFECESIDKIGNGADLAALFTAFDTAYTATIAPQIIAGVDSFDIVNAISANPTNGFAGSDTNCGGGSAFGLTFHSGDAPPILMQTLSSQLYDPNGELIEDQPLTPVTATYLDTIQVSGGTMTLYFYAGFFS